MIPAPVVRKNTFRYWERPIIPVSSLSKTGLDAPSPYLNPRKTVALIDSFGVEKSTPINAFFDKGIQKTADVLEADERDRYTTTVRQLFLLPNSSIR
jgi:ribosome biogenesis GTPase